MFAMPAPADLLARLDAIGRVLAVHPDARALIGLGSVGLETARLDSWSDLDFFVIVEPGAKVDFLNDPSLPWIAAVHPLAYVFRNTVDGCKLLFTDGIFAEMAVFEERELADIPYSPGRIVWKKPDVSITLATPIRIAPPTTSHDTAYLVGEALTNLHVGLSRELRGEHLAALRLIQHHAVDRVIELADLQTPTANPLLRDGFADERRLELRHPALARELPLFVPGYRHNLAAARALLAWLDHHVIVAPAMRAAILALCVEGEQLRTLAPPPRDSGDIT